MGRKVFISSDMSTDERLAELAETRPDLALLWPWFLTAFDDWGRAEAQPRRLKLKVFPMVATVTVDTVAEAIDAFAAYGLIMRYTVEQHEYMAIPTEKWFRYQTHIRGSKRSHDQSRFPAPPSDAPREAAEHRANARNSADPREDARTSAQLREDARTCTPSPSPSLSPSPSVKTTEPSVPADTPPRPQPPRASVEAKQAAAYLKAHLQQAGMTVFPRDWHLKAAAKAESLLRSGLSPPELRALIDWCVTDAFWRDKVTTMDKVADLVGQWQLQRHAGGGTRGNLPSSTYAGRHADSGALDALIQKSDPA